MISLPTLPPELYLKIIEKVAGNPHPDAYQIEGVSTLAILCLVNHNFLEWCRPILYSRVSLTSNQVNMFCRTVLLEDLELDSGSSSIGRAAFLNALGHMVKTLVLRHDGAETVPVDGIRRILMSMSNTLERLMINPTELVNRSAENWYSETIDFGILSAIHRMQNLKEFCNFQTYMPAPSILPLASVSSLRRLVLFHQQLPLQLPTSLKLFKHLTSVVIILPTFNPGLTRVWEPRENLFEIIKGLSSLDEITIFTEQWLSPDLWPHMASASKNGQAGAAAEREYPSIIEQKLRFVVLNKQPDIQLQRYYVMDAMVHGELWHLDRLSESTYAKLLKPKATVAIKED